jgi:hypothetical protein
VDEGSCCQKHSILPSHVVLFYPFPTHVCTYRLIIMSQFHLTVHTVGTEVPSSFAVSVRGIFGVVTTLLVLSSFL